MLPPELFDAIIEQARDDIATLNSCSLVCRSWLAISRHLTFGQIVFGLRPETVQGFLELIASPYATILPYIHAVELLGNDSSRGYQLEWLDRIITVLANIPFLTALVLENISWNELVSATRDTLIDAFQQITRLDLRASDFGSVAHLFRLVASKPRLRSLGCDNLGWTDPDPTETVIAPRMLNHLRLSGCYERDILDWLLAQTSIPPISDLELGAVRPEDTASIGNFLRRLGPRLRTLQLEFWSLDPGGDAEDFCAHVDLSYNSSLHTIVLDKFIHYSTYRFSSAVGWIPQLVSRAGGLKHIMLSISIRRIDELTPEDDPIDWPALDAVFCTLHRLYFRVWSSIELDQVTPVLTHQLPKCAMREGLLQFRSGFPKGEE
ncbi:hypothetical protein MIND_01220700 [Mycena indigotica]|uniref:F-box domain-containing protein n=1 Tax=Mycena indigotica TaxID=2126181 RepID=A0A8H6S3A4_9AGAR|nr:uncharacterized protein MIND_01220700 [Mycena indigotica]KAF7291951.1 hypothetical protein MIND_01220700 [Mycena indigotica]